MVQFQGCSSSIRQRLEKTERVCLGKTVLSKSTRRCHLAGKVWRPYLSAAACTEGSSELALAGSASRPGWHIEGSSGAGVGGKKKKDIQSKPIVLSEAESAG